MTVWRTSETDEGGLYIELTGALWPPKPMVDLVRAIGSAKRVSMVFKDSLGGSADIANAILNSISGKVVSCFLEGSALSASGFLFAASPGKRVMSKGARLMLHGCHDAVFGPASVLSEAAKHLDLCTAAMGETLAKRTGQPAEVVAGWLGEDSWFTSEQALRWGLADQVVPDPPASTEPLTASYEAAQTAEELLLLKVLRNFRGLQVGDKKRFAREIGAWLSHEVS